MVKFTVSLGYLRSIASWKPFSVKDSPALMCVGFYKRGDSLTAIVTDRYRIVMRTDDIGAGDLVSFVDDTFDNGLIAISTIVNFVATTRLAKGMDTVRIDVMFDEHEVTIQGAGSSITDRKPMTKYPAVVDLVEAWKINESNPVNPVAFDVSRIGDFAKIVSPKTNKKYGTCWKFEQGVASTPDKAGPYRLTNSDDVNVVALIQPNFVK